MDVSDSALPLGVALVFPVSQTQSDIPAKEQGDLLSRVRIPLEIVGLKSSALALIL